MTFFRATTIKKHKTSIDMTNCTVLYSHHNFYMLNKLIELNKLVNKHTFISQSNRMITQHN